MLTRIRLRRTASSLNSLSNNANENHHLRYGEALYSFADNMMVVGTETDQVISNIPNRIIAFPKISKNLVFVGPASGNNAFPTFRRLLAADMPDTYKSQGSATQPIYFNSSGVPTVISYTIAKSVPSNAVFTDRYVNSIAFADDTTANASKPIKLTLTRAGSDTTAVTGNIPKVSATSAGVVPKGAAVSSQTQNTKFLREDGTWAKPSYTTNLNTTYTFTNGTDGSFTVTPSGGTAQKVTIGKPTTAGTADIANKIGSADVGSAYAPVYIKAGVPKQITGNSALTNLASTTAASVFQQAPRFGVTGTLPVTNGGTGKASWTANQLVYATATNALGQLAPAQANQVIMSDASKKPTWSDPSNLVLSALDNTYVWDTITYDKRYTGSEGNLNSSTYIDLEHNLGNKTGGFVTLSPVSSTLNRGTDYSNYKNDLNNLNYSITVYETCTKSFSGGNIIYTLTGLAAQKTFPYTQLSGQITSSNYIAPSSGTIQSAEILVYTSSDRNCYVVPGIHAEGYQVTNPGIPTTLGGYPSAGIDEHDSTNWILNFHDHTSGSGSATLKTMRFYAFQCLLPVSGGYRATSCLQATIGENTWGYVSDYDVDVSFSYYIKKDPQIYYISQNWTTTTGTYNSKTHGLTTSGTARTFNLRRGSLTSNLSGKIFLGSRTGNDASSFVINFPESKSGTIYNIPRLIVYGNSSYLMWISTVNLDQNDTQPAVDNQDRTTYYSTISWYPTINASGASSCTGLTVRLNTSTKAVEYFNKKGASYTYYGFA